ncbi:hypothetical protein Btru_056206 [Bulinus truncatus]|nr:hypothetical protein Btru_056206 [Bulinus truncatus]
MESVVEDLSDEVKDILLTLNLAILNAIFCLFGIVANSVNVYVFWKQGFGENVNKSLFALAVADLCGLLTSAVFSIFYNPALMGAGFPIRPLDFINVTAAFPRVALSQIKSCITTFIALERCMCVVLPIKVKAIITPRTTVAVLLAIVTSLMLSLIMFYQTIYLDWRFDPSINATVLMAAYTHPDGPTDMSPLLSGHTAVQVTSFIAISLLTIVLAVRLKMQSRFRLKNARFSESALRENNRKSTRTIVLVLTMTATYIVCHSPGIAQLLVGCIDPMFWVFGPLKNYFIVTASLNILFESINSSVTIFLYYSMSVNYRRTLYNILRKSSTKEKKNIKTKRNKIKIINIVNDVSDELTRTLLTLNIAILNAVFAVFGIGANVINGYVFWKQGFSENVNISLFALSVVDMCELLAAVVFSVFYNPALQDSGLPVRPFEFVNVSVAFPRGALSQIKSAITTFIALERCMCVVMPIKVKFIITARTTAGSLVVIVSSLALTLIPFYRTIYLGWGCDPRTNRTILGAVYVHLDGPVDMSPLLSTHTAVQITSFIAISFFTVILAVKLSEQTRFRLKNARLSESALKENSRKSTRTIALVLTMTATYIVCYSPGMVLLLAGFMEPMFSVFGLLKNYFMLAVSVNILFESINSSVTIFLYYSMSVNYRRTLFNMFGQHIVKKK